MLERPTRDVDVLGMVKGAGELSVVAELLPEEVTRAAEMVAVDLNLPRDWLNDSAMEVQRLGLPEAILKRADKREFGPCLTVYLIGRQDQVALKLYAAIDRVKGQRHLKDLVAIEPTRAEMESAVGWLLDRKTSPQFRKAILKISEALGFSRLPGLATTELEVTPEAEMPLGILSAGKEPRPKRRRAKRNDKR